MPDGRPRLEGPTGPAARHGQGGVADAQDEQTGQGRRQDPASHRGAIPEAALGPGFGALPRRGETLLGFGDTVLSLGACAATTVMVVLQPEPRPEHEATLPHGLCRVLQNGSNGFCLHRRVIVVGSRCKETRASSSRSRCCSPQRGWILVEPGGRTTTTSGRRSAGDTRKSVLLLCVDSCCYRCSRARPSQSCCGKRLLVCVDLRHKRHDDVLIVVVTPNGEHDSDGARPQKPPKLLSCRHYGCCRLQVGNAGVVVVAS